MIDLYFLDAQTLSKEERITAYGGYPDDLVKDFLSWIAEKHILPEDIWYAKIFQHIRPHKDRCVYVLNLTAKDTCEIKPYEKITLKGLFNARRNNT